MFTGMEQHTFFWLLFWRFYVEPVIAAEKYIRESVCKVVFPFCDKISLPSIE